MRFSRRQRGFLALLMAGAVLAGCSDDATGPDPEALEPFVGTWFATKFEFTPISSVIPVSVDLIHQGLALTLQVNEHGRFLIAQGPPDEEPLIERGRLELNSDRARVTLVFDEANALEGSYFFRSEGEVLGLGLAGAEFDFNDDGETTPARVQLVLEKDLER